MECAKREGFMCPRNSKFHHAQFFIRLEMRSDAHRHMDMSFPAVQLCLSAQGEVECQGGPST